MSNPSPQPQLSSHNPFRSPFLTPNPTGVSATSGAPSYHSALPFSHTSLTPAPTGMSAVSSVPSYQTVVEDADSDDEDTPEPLPELAPRLPPRGPPSQPPSPLPPPSNNNGSLQSSSPPIAPPALPPRRPSSAAPPPPSSAPPNDFLPDDIPESAPPAYSVTPDFGGGESVVEQGPRRPFQRAPEPFLQPPPPPGPYYPPPPGPPGPTPERHYAPPPGPPPRATPVQLQPRYAPPPGAPPPPSHSRAASTSSGAGSAAAPSSDGHPTTTPTPGRPLLRNGRTLVYPESYLCPKCNNTGYKNFDPSHPCRKCWDRFGKAFPSVLASSPWGGQGSSATSQSQHGRTFQRPLPAFKPPQASATPACPRPPPPPPGAFPPHPPLARNDTGPAVLMPQGATPPPGSMVLMPGDPRIGGRRCWRCGGRGATPFLIFDEMPCQTCGGVGRLFN